MFRQMWTAVLAVIALVVAASCCTAAPASGNIPAQKKPGTNSIAMKMVLIPAGEFMMGNGHKAEDELTLLKPYYDVLWSTKYFDREYPQHRVRITRPFYMGAYHVTVGQFRQFAEASRYKTTAEESGIGAAGMDSVTGIYSNGEHREWSWRNPGYKQTDNHPVVSVSWDNAVAFCKWLGRKEGKTYRLPTEAEWEYACRARTTTRFYNGEDPEELADIANVWDQDCRSIFPPFLGHADISIAAHDGYVFTAPVGRFKPNAFRLYDMIGNAQQWCSDWFDEGYYSRSPTERPGRAKIRRASRRARMFMVPGARDRTVRPPGAGKCRRSPATIQAFALSVHSLLPKSARTRRNGRARTGRKRGRRRNRSKNEGVCYEASRSCDSGYWVVNRSVLLRLGWRRITSPWKTRLRPTRSE